LNDAVDLIAALLLTDIKKLMKIWSKVL